MKRAADILVVLVIVVFLGAFALWAFGWFLYGIFDFIDKALDTVQR